MNTLINKGLKIPINININLNLNLKINWMSVINYFLAIMLVLNNQSVYQNSVDKNYHIYELTLISILTSSMYYLLRFNIKRKNFFKWIYISAIYAIYLLVFTIFSLEPSQYLSFFSRYICFPFVLLIFMSNANYFQKVDIFKKFINVVTFISVMSLFFWIFGNFLHVIHNNGMTTIDWGSVKSVRSYYNLHFEIQWIDWLPTDVRRNTSVFVEGPMFCLVIMIALMFGFVYQEIFKIKRWQYAVIIAAAVTTFSMGIYIYICAFLFFWFVKYKKNKNKYYLVVFPLVIILAVCFLVIKSKTGSFALRMSDYTIGIRGWLKNPLFGGGYGKIDEIVQSVTTRKWVGFSNSLFSILVQGGLLYFLIYIIPILITLYYYMKNRDFKLLFLAVSYVYLLVTVIFNTAYINFFILVVMTGPVLYMKDSVTYSITLKNNKMYFHKRNI